MYEPDRLVADDDDDERFVPDAPVSLCFFVTVRERVRVVADEDRERLVVEFLFTVASRLLVLADEGRVATLPASDDCVFLVAVRAVVSRVCEVLVRVPATLARSPAELLVLVTAVRLPAVALVRVTAARLDELDALVRLIV